MGAHFFFLFFFCVQTEILFLLGGFLDIFLSFSRVHLKPSLVVCAEGLRKTFGYFICRPNLMGPGISKTEDGNKSVLKRIELIQPFLSIFLFFFF